MDLSTRYLGLALKHPIVASASPLAQKVDGIRRLEDSGLSAVVLPSLFEEQIEQEMLELHWATTQGTESFAEATTYFPEPERYLLGADEYLELIWKAKRAVDIPVIASLNGCTPGGWVRYAKPMEEAGADALELNIYFLATEMDSVSSEIEEDYLEILRSIKAQVSIPVALKLSPFFSSIASLAKRCDDAGADALVLFNRFYQPDLDLENLEVKPHVELSTSAEIRLPLRWIAILYGNLTCGLAATSGIHTERDVLKLLMAGADVTMMCSALFQNGPGHVQHVLRAVETWMEEHEYKSVRELQGTLSQRSVADPAAFERANYMKTLQSFRLTL
jgi:dihydroorotate dehydrogenase (fumarate)